MATTPAAGKTKKTKGQGTKLDSLPSFDSKTTVVDAPVVNRNTELARTKDNGFDRVTPAKVQAIINRIERGESERAACRAENISRSTFRIQALREVSGSQYARALEMLAADQVEALEKTIEDMRDGTIDASMARVEIDARKWFASKFLPKRYGDKLDLTSDGKQMPAPIISIAAVPQNKEINS